MSATVGRLPSVLIGLLLAASVVVVVAGLRAASGLLAPVLFAVTLAVLFTPLLRRLERRGLPTSLALLVMIIGLIAILGGVLLIVYVSLLDLQERLPVYQALLADRLAPLVERLGTSSTTVPSSWADGSALINAALAAITGLLSSAVGIVFFLFTLILLLIESSNFGRKIQAGLRPDNPFQKQLIGFAREVQEQYRIQSFSNFLSATALTAEFVIFRIDFAILWGFLAFVLGFIPNVGLIIACLPAVLLAFILHGPSTALVVFALGIILNAAMDNIVTPRFMTSGLNLPVLVSFLSFLFWSWVFGFLGALLAIPATLFVRALLASGQKTQILADILSSASSAATATDISVVSGVPGDGA